MCPEQKNDQNRMEHLMQAGRRLCEYKGKIEESSEEQIIIHKLPSSLEFTDIVHHSVDDPEITEVPSDPLDNAVWKIRLIMLRLTWNKMKRNSAIR